jgi:hypothetical protein
MLIAAECVTLLLAVCSLEFLWLRGLAEKGYRTFLDSYGAKNEAEFFAVATGEFFDRPLAFQQHAPELYRVRDTPSRRLMSFCLHSTRHWRILRCPLLPVL